MLKNLALALSLLLAACGPSAGSIGTAIAQTQAAMPTATNQPTATPVPSPTTVPTETPVPLAEVDIASLLVHPGDLPAGVTTGQVIKNGEAFVLFDSPDPEQKIFLEFGAQGKSAGGIWVWLFETVEDATVAYAEISKNISEDHGAAVDGKWDTALAEPPLISVYNILLGQGLISPGPVLGALAFQKCQAVVFVRVAYEREVLDPIVSYGNNVAQRLAPIACR